MIYGIYGEIKFIIQRVSLMQMLNKLSTLCLENDTDVAHYNFNAHQPMLVIFARYVSERVCYQTVVCYPTSPN